MSNQKQRDGYELYYIYATLRKLKSAHRARQSTISRNNKSTLDVSTFSREFLLKLLESRLSELDALCRDLVAELFRRLRSKKKKQPGQQVEDEEEELSPKVRNPNLQATKCRELDEYFHYSLHYLHDFLVELHWHENLADLLPDDISPAVKSKLEHVKNFVVFQRILTEVSTNQNVNPNKQEPSQPKEESQSPPSKSAKSIKSVLSSSISSKLSSPSRKRRVRFQESSSPELDRVADGPAPGPDNDRDLSDSHSILALDLLLFALNYFTQHLLMSLADWQSSGSDGQEPLALISKSKQKIRTSQLYSISRQIKCSNDVYLTILEHLSDMRKIYLNNCVLNIICSRDVGRELNNYKTIRVRSFIMQITLDVERKVISNLAEQCLQILLDLVVSEINLPPVELNAATSNRSKVEVSKSRDNYLNFITSWMNVDDIVFGFISPKKRSSSRTSRGSRVDMTATTMKRTNDEPSTLATGGGNFKSSSRILAQMDNLNELMRDLLAEVCARIRSHKQMKYLLELIHAGLELSFDVIEAKLNSQFTLARETIDMNPVPADSPQDLKAINKTVDMIAFKVRSLKFIHVFSSIDQLIKELASNNQIELHERHLERKLEEFTEKCTQQTGSTYKN